MSLKADRSGGSFARVLMNKAEKIRISAIVSQSMVLRPHGGFINNANSRVIVSAI